MYQAAQAVLIFSIWSL